MSQTTDKTDRWQGDETDEEQGEVKDKMRCEAQWCGGAYHKVEGIA
jgi:hypothetical protein